MDRRAFLTTAAGAAVGLCLPALGGCDARVREEYFRRHFLELKPEEVRRLLARLEEEARLKFGKACAIEATPAMQDVLFGYALDISRCVGCRRCVHACVKENNTSRDPEIQWIRVLECDKEKGIDFAEANPYYGAPAARRPADPLAPLDARQKDILEHPDSQYPLYQKAADPTRGEEEVPRKGHFYVPISCQQCKHPPCVKVCPVKATWSEPDGIVTVDYDWCIGCRYCMAACPYGARHFNWAEPQMKAEDVHPHMHYLGNRPRPKGVVEKCTFCIQRSRHGRYPACVEICPVGARKFGNLLDPAGEIRYILEHKRVLILKNELNTQPKFFYFFSV